MSLQWLWTAVVDAGIESVGAVASSGDCRAKGE